MVAGFRFGFEDCGSPEARPPGHRNGSSKRENGVNPGEERRPVPNYPITSGIQRREGGRVIGAIAGDIVGSRWEGSGRKETQFDLFDRGCRFTDDSVLSIAVADCLLNGGSYGPMFHLYYERYPYAGYGSWFAEWARSRSDRPYGSFGNGGAMRVVPVGWAFDSADDVLREAERSAAVTHDHPEGVKGARAVALAVFLARSDGTKGEIRDEL
ncbi:MAG TPA: ADP-ribosylglycohydrolase family protein, partial [Thermoanaerobaculia bacterium]|nr:ADP-ribosylglycohydrolase family protein [Thermoanaerobaculia bacterium]